MTTPSNRSGAATKADGARPAAPRADRKGERASLRPGGAESLVGVVLSGRYLIERLIGEGGMGAVYQAEHTHMHKRMAVKVLHAEMSRLPEVVARFEREAMAAAHIEHPNVAAATDFGKLDDGSFFLVLEYVEGRSLRDAIAEGRLSIERVVNIARQIASALARAHALGIVHRDLKPENVMLVARDGDPDFVKVLDFGIAKVPVGELGGEPKGQALTQLGMVYGTPEYMAPEQALGQSVDARADLYALGVIMFEMLAGGRPYEHASKVTLLGMHVTAPIPSVSERAPEAAVPPEMEAIVTCLLAKESTSRFADSRELIEALDESTLDRPAAGQVPSGRFTPRSRAHLVRAGDPRPGGDGGSAVLATGQAKPAPPAAGAVQGFVSLVGASLGQVVRRAPPWARGRLALSASVVFGFVFLGAFVVSLARGRPTQGAGAAGSAGAATARVLAPKPDPKTDDIISSAQANIDKADFATAIDQLTGVEKGNPDRADVHMGLEKAYTGARNGRDAMREAGLWLAADPSAAADHKLEEDVRNAALVKETQEQAFELLESKLGSVGVDILYDIAFGATGRLYPQAASRAKRSLTANAVRGRASNALGVLLELREAKGCEAKHALLERARDQGDARILTVLQQFEATRGCGFLNVADCYPCMRRDGLLGEAIAAIEERITKGP
ncbi:MAG: serine/threonine-protein kinase [Polyangiaceae bacterium]